MAQPDKLVGARLKLKRANKHIRDLDIALKAFKKTNPHKIATKRNDKGYLIVYVKSVKKVPINFALLAGDALFNLRSALDHTALQLWVASGCHGNLKDVYFPISESPAKHGARVAVQIQGARPDIVKALDLIEPYKAGLGHQLWVLHRLNITDKHRLLLTVAIGYRPPSLTDIIAAKLAAAGKPKTSYGVVARVGQNEPLYATKAGDILLEDQTPNAKFSKHMKFTTEITLNEPEVPSSDSIIKTLHDLSKLVADVIHQLGRLL
jgi:hypothetical protein